MRLTQAGMRITRQLASRERALQPHYATLAPAVVGLGPSFGAAVQLDACTKLVYRVISQLTSRHAASDDKTGLSASEVTCEASTSRILHETSGVARSLYGKMG